MYVTTPLSLSLSPCVCVCVCVCVVKIDSENMTVIADPSIDDDETQV